MNSFLQVFTFIALTGSTFGYLERAMERAGGSGWNYAGQAAIWPFTHPYCAGKRQSPIDIDNSKTFDMYAQNTVDFSLYNTKKGNVKGKLSNVGSSLKFTPTETNVKKLPGISNGTLPGNFNLLQFHFHWGSTNDRGSEHTVDGKSFAMELHLVHVNKKYMKDIQSGGSKALTNPDGLAVVGIMFVVGQNGSDFAPLQPVVDAALAMHDDQTVQVPATIDHKKFLKAVGPGYYNYDGSLTTPTCNEVVSWYVMEGAIAISQAQLDAFKGLKYPDGAPMVDNYRPPQPVNNRIVKRFYPAM